MTLVYIARALDKSWAATAESEADARRKIAAYEPDPAKHSDYQILVEPMERLLANQVPGIERGLKHRIVKWDGDAPIPDDASERPERYSQVSEVLEGGDGIPTTIIYRRP